MTRKQEAGQALIFAALGLGMLLGAAGLGVDMGVLRYEKRLQQTAADAAAVAGASNLAPYTGVTTGARNASASSGFTNTAGAISNCSNTAAVGTVCVEVLNPPAARSVNGVTIPAGPHSGLTNYVEVIVATVQPTYFMKIFGVTKETVVARAVATNISAGGPNTGCLYTLGGPTSSIEGVNINGHATLNAPTCGISDNGNWDPAGGAYTVSAGTFGVSGACTGNHCTDPTCSSGQTPCPTLGVPAAANPLAYLQPPTIGANQGAWANGNGPGTYSGVSITGNGNYNFPPGIYVLTGDFTCHGTPTITGTGVMFYFTNGATYNCSGNDTISFTAPSTGTYAGILMYQDPSDTNGPSVGGNTGSSYTGTLYFPSSEVTFFGNAGANINVGIVVADAFALSGTPFVNMQGTAGLPPGVTVGSVAQLVE